MALKKGKTAPDFTLPSTSSTNFHLSENLPCILYFYPKDFTPGCTKEACYFRDEFSFFRDLNIKIIGINRDDLHTHLKFKEKHNLPFELLSDETGEVVREYGANIPFISLIKRITYLINTERKVESVYESLFAYENHMKEMIRSLKN
jgi:thioredoxin-dependent peroxiredoxin